MRRLFLTYAKSRFLYGETKYNIPSRFLCEAGLVERKAESVDVFTASPSYRGVGQFARASASGYSSDTRGQKSGAGGATFGGEKFDGTYKSGFGATMQRTHSVQNSGSDKARFVVGARVMHKRLGAGTILSVENVGNNLYAKIEFERGGIMNLAVDFAPLTVIEE